MNGGGLCEGSWREKEKKKEEEGDIGCSNIQVLVLDPRRRILTCSILSVSVLFSNLLIGNMRRM